MAVIEPGPIVTDIRGKLGGVVFSLGPSGNTARVWRKPTTRHTPQQASPRSSITQQAAAWTNDLTQSQRDDWIALGAATTLVDKFGNNFNPNGFNTFMRSNLSLLVALQDPVQDAPLNATNTETAPTVVISGTTGDIRINAWTTLSVPPVGMVQTWVSPPMSLGRSFFSTPWLLAGQRSKADTKSLGLKILDSDDMLDPARYFVRIVVAATGPQSGAPPNNQDGRISFPLFDSVDNT